MKIVINKGYGDFDLSEEAYILYAKLKGFKLVKHYDKEISCEFYYKNEVKEENRFVSWFIERNDPALVQVVETLGDVACLNKKYTRLKVVEIPDDVKWFIDRSDDGGGEWVAEVHRTWS